MGQYRGELSRMLFDHTYPPVSWIGTKYKKVDISDHQGLTGKNIADAINELKENEEALILPEKAYFGGRPYKARDSGIYVPLDTPTRFRKFGPSLDIVKSGATIAEVKEEKITPRKALKEALSDPEIRENLKAGFYRCIGYWGPRSGRHNVIWLDVLAEGQAFLSHLKGEFTDDYQVADSYQQVPSFKQTKTPRTLAVRVLPVTERKDWFYVEWLEEDVNCTCKDSFFMGARSKKKEAGKFEDIYKHALPEQIICRHNWSSKLRAEEIGDMPGMRKILIKLPRAKGGQLGYLTFWKKTKTQTFIRHGSGYRRPLKLEVGIICGYDLGISKPEDGFDLSEEEFKLAA